MTNDDLNTGGGATAGTRRSPRQGVGGSPFGSTLSIVLAVLAVVLGFLILRNITDDNSASDGGGAAVETTVPSSAPVTELTTTTTTVPQLVTTGATVLVANASGVPGSAGRMSDELAAIGFTLAEPTNATSGLEQSVVHADPANAAAQAVAESVARSMGNLAVEPLPATIPVEGGSLGDATVLVLLGTAQADKTIAEMSTPAPATVTPPPVAGGTTTGTDAATTGTTTG